MKVQLEHITKTFGGGPKSRTVLDDISWEAHSGEILGILGPNGAGKSTMMRVLLNILPADRGNVVINEGAMSTSDERFRHLVGYLPEDRSLYPSSKVKSTIAYFGVLKGLKPSDAEKKADELVTSLEIQTHSKFKNSTLSKGLAQRVQLACCLIHSPELIILDEPFSGLDPVNSQTVRNLLLERRRQGSTILLCTHQMREVETLCDRVVMISAGQLALYGRTEEIRAQYANVPFEEIFVAVAKASR